MVTKYDSPALRVLLPEGSVTTEELIAMIKGRRSKLIRDLPLMPLVKLGDFVCLDGESRPYNHGIGFHVPTTGDDGLTLETRGVFGLQPWEAFERHLPGRSQRDRIIRLWGLTGAAQWIIVTVTVKYEAGYKERGNQRAEAVHITSATLEQMLEITKEDPKQVWYTLGTAIKRYADARKADYHRALELVHGVEADENAYRQRTGTY